MNKTTSANGVIAEAEIPQLPAETDAAGVLDVLEQISPDEMAYHQQVLAAARAASAAFTSWGQHLANKYKIGQTDRINEDGTISRNVPQQAQPGSQPQG